MMAEDARQTNTSPHPDSGILESVSASAPWTPQQKLKEIASNELPLDNFVPNSKSPVAFFHLLERLKTTKREGWRRFNIDHGESIADHMYRMSWITKMAPTSLSSRIDLSRCSTMALVHDMAESLVGDITPVDNIAKDEKHRREATTMDYICNELLGNVDGGSQGREMRAIWQEYEDSDTLESKFVHDVDKIELVLQMVEYERSHQCRIDLSEFVWVARRIELPEIRLWCDQILKERDVLWMSVGAVPKSHETPKEA